MELSISSVGRKMQPLDLPIQTRLYLTLIFATCSGFKTVIPNRWSVQCRVKVARGP